VRNDGYDLTNTDFEGDAESNPKAQRGHSQEKRTDGPLVTLALVLDGSGLVRKSECFNGNVAAVTTLETLLHQLEAPSDALVVMDRGIASEENLAWLREQHDRYLVASREQNRQLDPEAAMTFESAGGDAIVNVQPPGSAGVSPALRPGWPQPQDAGRLTAINLRSVQF
jgi:transposase